MSNVRGRDFSVKGDGIAIGAHNSVTVIKHEKHHHHHGSRAGKSDGSSKGGGEVLIAAGAAVITACVVGSYLFALHASLVYSVLQAVFALQFAVAFAVVYQRLDQEQEWDWKVLALTFLAAIASAALLGIHMGYADELTTIAEAAAGAQQFWCDGLSNYGRQQVLLHMIVGVFGFGAAGLLLTLSTGSMFFERIFGFDPAGRLYEAATRCASWGAIGFGGLLLMIASYLHTDSGWETWTKAINQPPVFFCKAGAQGVNR